MNTKEIEEAVKYIKNTDALIDEGLWKESRECIKLLLDLATIVLKAEVPEKNYYSHGSLRELPITPERSAFSEGYDTAIDACLPIVARKDIEIQQLKERIEELPDEEDLINFLSKYRSHCERMSNKLGLFACDECVKELAKDLYERIGI